MSVFDRFFKSEEKPVAAIGGEPPDAPVEVVGAHATTKLKLNFKRLPKKMVQAIADQTTGQTIDRSEEDRPLPRSRSSLSDAFAAAARDVTRDDRGRGSEARAMAAPMRPERFSMPRAPSPSP